MTFAISGFKQGGHGSLAATELTLYDTKEEALLEAENWLKKGYRDVAVWQQIGVPKLVQSVHWETKGAGENE